MQEYDLLSFADTAVKKIIRELDVEDIAWFLLDKDEKIVHLFAENMREKDRKELILMIGRLNRDNLERYKEGKERTLRAIRVLVENGDITPDEIMV